MKHYQFPRKFPEQFERIKLSITSWGDNRTSWDTILSSPWSPYAGLRWDEGSELMLIPERKQFVHRHQRFKNGKPLDPLPRFRDWFGGWWNGEWFINELHCGDHTNPIEILKGENGLRQFDRYLKPDIIHNLESRWRVKSQRYQQYWAISLTEEQLEMLKRMVRTLLGARIRVKSKSDDHWVFNSSIHLNGETSPPIFLNHELFYVVKGVVWKMVGPPIRSKRRDLLTLNDSYHLISASSVWTDDGPPL